MLNAILIVGGVGFLLSVMLVIASKVFYVETDKTATLIRDALPGANCGACGYAGCDEYANALAADKSVATNLCKPGGDRVSQKISEILNVEFADVIEVKAHMKCNSTNDTATLKAEYDGPQTCEACHEYYMGKRTCPTGCLGFGDCVAVCMYHAISVENGLAKIDPDLCTGCGACVKICPQELFQLARETNTVYVACNLHDKGASKMKFCKAACIACKKCEKACDYDAIHVIDNLAEIDYEKCTSCGECVKVCPTHVIKQYSYNNK